MHLVTVAPSIPSPSYGGTGNWGESVIRYFAEAGHRVTHVAIIGKHMHRTADERLIEAYKKLGVDVVVVPHQKADVPSRLSLLHKLKMVSSPKLKDFWPNEVETQVSVVETLRRLNPDCVLPFSFLGVLCTDGVDFVSRVGIQAEGPYINEYVNWRYDPLVPPGVSWKYLSYTLRTFALARIQEKLYAELTSRLTIAGFQGPAYVSWAKRRGLKIATFVTAPTPDPAGSRWRELKEVAPRNAKFKILMIGHLNSTSNRAGLPVFFHEVLPALEEQLGTDEFEIHIVGRNDGMPKRFDRWRDHPALVFRGPVFPSDDEFITSDLLLVTIPAKTGSRVRIINGFSFGCCVVAHSADGINMPELRDDENLLMADTGKGIAGQVIRAARDPELRRRLGENGRKVYEQYYSESVGGAQYLRLAEKAVAEFRTNNK